MGKFKKWFGDTFDKDKMSEKQYNRVKAGLGILIVLAVAILAVITVYVVNVSRDNDDDSSSGSSQGSSQGSSASDRESSSLGGSDSQGSSSHGDSSAPESSSQPDELPLPEGVTVVYSISNTWENSGKLCRQIDLNIKNNTEETLNPWVLTLSVEEGDTVDGWNASYEISGGKLTVKPENYNSEIYPDGSISIGFILTSSGEFKGDSITVNGAQVNVVEGSVSGDNNQQPQQGGQQGQQGQTSVDVEELLKRSDDAVQGDDWLFVKNNKIVDKDGKEVWITGVNWFGYNTGTNIFDGLWGSELVSSVTSIADHGFNLIRIPFSAELINQWSEGEYPKANYNQAYNPDLNSMNSLEIFDYVLKLCEANGIKVMIDIHCAKTDASGHMVNLWYNDSVTTEDYYHALEWMADRYKDNDTIVAYDLKNEPHGKPYEGDAAAKWDGSSDKNNWKHVAETAAARVLAKNPNVLILVEGIEIYPIDIETNGDFHSKDEDDYYFNWWGGNLRGVKDNPIDLGKYQDKLVYSPHDYGPTVYQQPWFKGSYDFDSLMEDCWHDNWFYIYEEGIAPLLIGEWGGFMTEPNITWMTYMRQLIKDNHLHHTFWCFNANSGDTGGLVKDDFTTWDEEKYAFVKEVLWQEKGKFVGLDHEIPLGKNGITLSDAKGL